MRFHAAISDKTDARAAAESLAESVRDALRTPPDLLCVFMTANHLEDAGRLLEHLHGRLEPGVMIGCSAEGILGASGDVERAPGVSVLAAHMPGARLHPFHISRQRWGRVLGDQEELCRMIGHGGDARALLAVGDPFTTPVRQMLHEFNERLGDLPVIGGMASAARAAGGNILVCNDKVYPEGMVGLTVGGAVEVTTVVSQGCRPIGQTFVITRAHDNVIDQLGGKPALAALRETVEAISEQDRRLLQSGLFIGRAISEYRESFARGDFIVRNVIGLDQESGGIALADYVRAGQTVQFHVRDAQTAGEDLLLMLAAESRREPAPAGGLLFTCNGRGCRMFGRSGHDIGMAQAALPRTPLAGFFAAGELGPVGGQNFIHGHTACLALFRPK